MSELNQGDGERNGLMQVSRARNVEVRKESDRMARRRAKRDHYTYTLRDGRFIVKYGITTNPNQRMVQMENKGLRFTSMTINPIPVSKETALKREEEKIKAYQRGHKGRKPRYNK